MKLLGNINVDFDVTDHLITYVSDFLHSSDIEQKTAIQWGSISSIIDSKKAHDSARQKIL
jgi:hypothetical protein